MLSLGSVLRGAIPLLLTQQTGNPVEHLPAGSGEPAETPVGAGIIRIVRAYQGLTLGRPGTAKLTPTQRLRELQSERGPAGDRPVLEALQRVVLRGAAPRRCGPPARRQPHAETAVEMARE